MGKKRVVEAIEEIGKFYDTLPLNSEDLEVKVQAVAPEAYVDALETAKKSKEKFEKMVEDKVEAAGDSLENTDKSRFKRMREDGKADLDIKDEPLKKIFLDESLFESYIEESKDALVFGDDDEERLTNLAKKFDLSIIDYDDLIHFQIAGRVADIKDFEEAYLKEFEKELAIYADKEYYSESLNEGFKEKLLSLFKKKGKDNFSLIDISDIVDEFDDDYYSTPKADSRYKMRAESLEESKKPLKEAIIVSDLKSFKPWNKGIETWDRIIAEDKLDQLESLIEQMYPDGIEEQTFNDLLSYDDDYLELQLNLKPIEVEVDEEEVEEVE